jgi:hypothetical protein
MSNRLRDLRVSDPVITSVVQGYVQEESIAPFVAPVVPVYARAGRIVKFTKEQFVVVDTSRAPGEEIKKLTVSYTNENYTVNQHAAAGKVTEEEYEEAAANVSGIDLRIAAAQRATQAVMQSWEREVVSTITNPALYEADCVQALAGTDKFNDPVSDPDQVISAAKEAVRSQIGLYPNSAVISPKVFNALKNHPLYRDRIKYTSSGSVNLDMLATWLDLSRGIKVASRVYLDPVTNKLVDFMTDDMVLFYSPEGDVGRGFMPTPGASKETPAYAYTYSLSGYPIAMTEHYDENTRSFITDVVFEQALILTGMGATDKCGSGFLLRNVI